MGMWRLLFVSAVVASLLVCCAESRGGRRGSRMRKMNEEKGEGKVPETITTSQDHDREGKLFSLFSLVTFSNSECHSAENDDDDEDRRGTCFTAQECQDKGGRAEGNCAAGFGVCCIFVIDECGGTVGINGTYIQNAGFPRGNNTHQSCTFNFGRISQDICQIRLDFETFSITAPVATSGNCEVSGDRLVVSSPTGAGAPENLCGTLTGQHMYVESGSSGDAGSMTVHSSVSDSPRTFDVRVSYIGCASPVRAPEGCLQYFTGAAGQFSTYGFQSGVQPDAQRYSFCFRKEDGFCSYQIHESGDAKAFDLTRDPTDITAVTDSATCSSTDLTVGGHYIRVQVEDSQDLRCGGTLSNHEGDTTPGAVASPRGVAPFVVEYYLADVDDAAPLPAANPLGAGFSLEYAQIPC